MSKFEGLDEVGLTEYEQEAYIGLLRCGDLTGPELSSKTEIPKTRVYDVLRSLEDRGLVSQIQQSPMKFAPNDLEDSLGSEFTKKINKLDFLREQTIEELSDLGSEEKEEASDSVDVFKGEDQMFQQIAQRIQGCEKELKILGVGRSPPKPAEIEVRKLVKRGVDVKFILTTEMSEVEMTLSQASEIGVDVRRKNLDSDFALMLIDETQFMISVLDPENQEDRISIFFENNALSGLMSQYFDELWQNAASVP